MTAIFEWESTRALVMVRASQRCEGCGKANAEQVHHRQPRGMGGVHGVAASRAHAPSNLMALCLACHDFTEDQPLQARAVGWLVQHPIIPGLTPVRMTPIYGYGWYLLLDDLTYRLASDAEVRGHAAHLAKLESPLVADLYRQG